jgi:hypothetical protein
MNFIKFVAETRQAMKIRRLKNIPMPQHVWVEKASKVVARFGELGKFPVDSFPPHVVKAGKELSKRVKDGSETSTTTVETISCYRVAFVREREDGQMFEDYFDYKIGEPDSLREKKAQIIESRFATALDSEQCVTCKEVILPDQFALFNRGHAAHLRWKCIWGLKDTQVVEPGFRGSLFASGGTFSLVGIFQSKTKERLKEIHVELVDTEIDSSLTDPNIVPTFDGIREALRRGAESRAKYAKYAK